MNEATVVSAPSTRRKRRPNATPEEKADWARRFAESGLRRSPRERIAAFAEVLQSAGIVTTVRRTRGDDIAAACGQLAGEVRDRTRVAQRLSRGTIPPVRAETARR